jgi:hypothetical protein
MATAEVDSYNIPKRMMTKIQLEWWILFGICVAGKGAKTTEKKLRAFLDDMPRSPNQRRRFRLCLQQQKPISAGEIPDF